MTGGATGSIFYFDFACTTNFPFPFLMAPVEKYMRHIKLVEVVRVAYVDDEKCVDNSLVQILKVKFGLMAEFLFRL